MIRQFLGSGGDCRVSLRKSRNRWFLPRFGGQKVVVFGKEKRKGARSRSCLDLYKTYCIRIKLLITCDHLVMFLQQLPRFQGEDCKTQGAAMRSQLDIQWCAWPKKLKQHRTVYPTHSKLFCHFPNRHFCFSWCWRIAGVKEVGTQQDSNGGAKVNRGLIDEWQGSETKKDVVLCHRHTIIFKGFWVAVTLRSCYFLSQLGWKFVGGYYTKLAPARFILGTKMALWFSQQLKSCICF